MSEKEDKKSKTTTRAAAKVKEEEEKEEESSPPPLKKKKETPAAAKKETIATTTTTTTTTDEEKDSSAVEALVAEAATIATAAVTTTAATPPPPTSNKEKQKDTDDTYPFVALLPPSIEVDSGIKHSIQQASGTNIFKRHSDVGERDVVVNNREDNQKMFLFLEDLVHMYNVLWHVQQAEDKTTISPTEQEYDEAAKHIMQVLKKGKKYELGGLRDVPRPFLKSPGRILERQADESIKEVSDDDAASMIRKKLVEKVEKDPLGDLVNESPYKEFKRILERNKAQSANKKDGPVPVESGDAILTNCVEQERELEQQGESKVVFNIAPQQVLFNLAAQIVTTYTINSETQVKAALAILNGLDETDFPPLSSDGTSPAAAGNSPSSIKHSRFLIRSSNPEDSTSSSMLWNVVPDAEVLEFAVTFVFEVHIEKDLDYITSMLPVSERHGLTSSTEDQSKVPAKDEPKDYDVLFGRGGMTNCHIGNRRFRDIIALHRPDYIRAIKMDKPAVARKIVKGIRFGNPPGRFLKKSEDGNWYDVGDRTATEKTSQGLRERTNAEKRQRSQLRRALRLRREDMDDEEEESETSSTPHKKIRATSIERAMAVAVSTPEGKNAIKLAATLAPTLNYVGTNIGVPLSLNMAAQVVHPYSKKKSSESASSAKVKPNSLGLNTEGLPPNAVDAEGNILVTDHDILLGRGGLTNHHRGNKRFRDIVALHRPDYVRAPKIQKPSVARVIVRAIRNGDPPGRFLRKDEKTGKWVDVGDKKAAEKTSQALREKATDERENDMSSVPVGILVPTPASYLAATTANVMGNILAAGTYIGSEEKKGIKAEDGAKDDSSEKKKDESGGTAEESKDEAKGGEEKNEHEASIDTAVEV